MIDFFYSDPHYGHTNMIKYAERPFADVVDQTDQLIGNYNAVVGTHDTVLWLGDCFWAGTNGADILNQLHGTKWLVIGNHDSSASDMLSAGFDLVVEEMVVRIGGVRCRINHFPAGPDPLHEMSDYGTDRFHWLRPRTHAHEILIHGHTHSKDRLDMERGTIHVGIDAWDYMPAAYDDVEHLVQKIIAPGEEN